MPARRFSAATNAVKRTWCDAAVCNDEKGGEKRERPEKGREKPQETSDGEPQPICGAYSRSRDGKRPRGADGRFRCGVRFARADSSGSQDGDQGLNDERDLQGNFRYRGSRPDCTHKPPTSCTLGRLYARTATLTSGPAGAYYRPTYASNGAACPCCTASPHYGSGLKYGC